MEAPVDLGRANDQTSLTDRGRETTFQEVQATRIGIGDLSIAGVNDQ